LHNCNVSFAKYAILHILGEVFSFLKFTYRDKDLYKCAIAH